MSLADYLFVFSLIIIWLLILYNVFLTFCAYRYRDLYFKKNTLIWENFKQQGPSSLPTVTVLIPAHNEERVIYRTILALAMQNYPQDKFNVIAINDGSTDRTKNVMHLAAKGFDHVSVLDIPSAQARRGKSNALNYAIKEASGDVIAVYDADNTPQVNALLTLILHLQDNSNLAAVIGKFKTRNKKASLLTRFINLETLGFQWIAQAGRAFIFKVVTIPGTNFAIHKHILEKLGGWDPEALTEDTEMSVRIYQLGYRIGFALSALTYEEEPAKLKIWFKQRTRWARGNLYVVGKFIFKMHTLKSKAIASDILHMFILYFFFMLGIVFSSTIFILGLFRAINLNVEGPFAIIWILGIFAFVASMASALVVEEDEFTVSNIALLFLMYFTYSQLWFIVTIRSLYYNSYDKIFGRKVKWDKTEREEHDF